MEDEQKDQSEKDTGQESEQRKAHDEDGADIDRVFEKEVSRLEGAASEITASLEATLETAAIEGVDLSAEQADIARLQERLDLVSDQTRRQIVLINISRSGDWFEQGDRFYTDEELKTAGENEEAFMALVERGLTRAPDRIFNMVDSAKILFPREELVAALDRGIETAPHQFLSHFPSISEYYDDKKEVLTRILSNENHVYLATSGIFNSDVFDNIFTPEEAKPFILQAAHKRPDLLFQSHNHAELNKLLEKGYINEDDVRNVLIGIIRDPNAGYFNLGAYAHSFEGEDMNAYKAAITAAFGREENPFGLTTLSQTHEIFTPEERKALFLAQVDKGKKTGDSVLRHPQLLREFYAEDEINDLIHDAFVKRDYALFGYEGLPKWIKDGGYLTADELHEHKIILMREFPFYAFKNLEYILEAVPDEDKAATVKSLAKQAGAESALRNIASWMPYITDDLQEQKDILSDIIRENESYGYAKEFITDFGSEFRTDKVLTREEVKELLFEGTRNLSPNFIIQSSEFRDIRNVLGSDEEFKDFISVLGEAHPKSILFGFNTIAYLYDEGSVSSIIDNIAAKSKNEAANCIDTIKFWLPYDSPDHTLAFLHSQKDSNPLNLMEMVGDYKSVIPEDQQDAFLRDIIKADPPAALSSMDSLTPHLPGLTPDEVAQMALDDQERIAYAPRTFTEFYRRALGSKDITDKKALLTEMHDLYEFVGSVRVNGLQEAHRRIIEGQELSPKQEQLLLANIACAAFIKERDPEGFEGMGSLGDNPEELANVVLQELSRRTGFQEELTPEQKSRFLETMDTPAPFLIYLLQYENSPQHKKILDGISQGILQGNYKEWKFGESTAESISDLKERNLLPDVSVEQYAKWQTNESTTLQETLAADADTVTRAVRRLIYENGKHFSKTLFEDPNGDYKKMLRDAQDELTQVGQEYGQVARALSVFKTDEEKALPEAIDLQEKRSELAAARDELNMAKNLLRVMLLQPDEVSSGYLLEGSKKTTKITKVLDDLGKLQSDQEARAVLDNVRQLVVGFHEQTDEKQNLVAEDTDNPKVLLELGAKPVGSCQHYAHGEYNECLLGYSDPNTKIVTLRNERGNLVARAVLRLLPTQDGDPALHLEKIYSASASQGVTRTIYAHVEAKARAMDMKAYLSKQAQDEHGNLIEAETIPGFQLVDSDTTMKSEASRAPKSYVDSAQGSVENGHFELNNLQLLEAA